MALKPTSWTLPVTVPETAVTFWSLTFDFADTGAIVTRIQIIDAAMPIVRWNSLCVRIRRSFRVVQQLRQPSAGERDALFCYPLGISYLLRAIRARAGVADWVAINELPDSERRSHGEIGQRRKDH